MSRGKSVLSVASIGKEEANINGVTKVPTNINPCFGKGGKLARDEKQINHT